MLPFERTSTRRTANPEKGQSLVEMCFGLVVLLMIVSGVIDIGRAYFAYVALEDSAGEGALYMSAFPDCAYDDAPSGVPRGDNGADDGCDPPHNAVWRAQNSGGQADGIIDWSNARPDITCVSAGPDDDDSNNPDPAVGALISCEVARTGDSVTVFIEYDFKLLSPVIPDINGGSTLVLRSKATQLITAPTD
jgi:hypothetical protein